MKTHLVALIALVVVIFVPTIVSADVKKAASAPKCSEYDIYSQSFEPCASSKTRPRKPVQKATNPCTKYDIYSQSFEACGSSDTKPRKPTKKATNRCTKYDIYSQSFEPC
jgi:hypothetical protein